MPTLTINLPTNALKKIRVRARQYGFKSPESWATFLVEKNLELEESPNLPAQTIIEAMGKTGLYQKSFLRALQHSLRYADQRTK